MRNEKFTMILTGTRRGLQAVPRKFALSCLLFLLPLLHAYSQRSGLGKDSDDFSSYLLQYLVSDPNLDKDTKEYLEEAVPGYLAFYAALDKNVREEVASLARSSYKARLKPYPGLWDFLQVQRQMQEQHPSEQGEWFDALRVMLKKNRARYFSDLVEKTRELMQDGRLYESNAAFWRISASGFRFEAEPEPRFCFEEARLSCHAYQDSTVIHGTSGVFYPMKNRFDGHGGRTYWTRSGFHPDSCWTELQSFTINLRQGRYESDGWFTRLDMFPEPLYGHYEERLFSGGNLDESRYPQFVSAEDNLQVRGIYRGLDVTGPFVQQGYRANFGEKGRKASLEIWDDGIVRVRIRADRIVFGQERFTIPEASICMYLDEDSLYNPMVSVRFDDKERILHVGKVENMGLESPYIDTYHQLRMDFEALRWYVDEGRVDIGLLDVPGREGVVSFKSLSVFSRKELGSLMLGAEENPLYMLSQLAKAVHSDAFSLGTLADYMRMSSTQALALLKNLIEYGYVSYDPSREWIELLPRLYHTLQVTADRVDFDELEFATSEQGIIKATMNLDSLVLKMRGVPYVLLSRKQNMYVRPLDSVVEIYKNRDFHFDGFLNAGAFDFEVRGGCFYYDAFKVDIADVRQLGLEVKVMVDGRETLRPVVSKIRYLAGVVYIDDPSNKGGRRDFPQYPVLENTQPSIVYYDEPYVQGGVYTADSFYFQVDPFRMEKLNTIQTDSLRFRGTLVSAGIFPDIRDELRVMPDLSLGFSKSSPPEGWPTYGGMALFQGDMSLDNSGLSGNGVFSYMDSRSRSDRMVLRPRDMEMDAGDFRLEPGEGQGVQYPMVEGMRVHCALQKDDGKFRVSSVQESLLHVFDQEWTLDGTYAFAPRLSSARGVFHKQDEAHVSAEFFSVRTHGFASDSVGFKLGPRSGPGFMETSGHVAEVDLDRRDALFHSLSDRSPVEFGFNQYRGHLSSIYWDMDRKTAELKHDRPAEADAEVLELLSERDLFTVELPGEYFESTRRAQAGLGFNAQASSLNCEDTSLRFTGVRRLLVADAMFVPAGQALVVAKSGMLQPLVQAKLYFGDRERLHSFHDVSAMVQSSRQYQASGFFDYRAPDMATQPVYFEGIRPKDGGHSVAEARIVADSMVLSLDEGFQFIGKIELDARQTYPFFDGVARMVYACVFPGAGEMPEDDWHDGDAGYDDFECEDPEGVPPAEEDVEEGAGNGSEDRTSRRGREKASAEEGSEDTDLHPAAEAAALQRGNPFLADGFQFSAYVNSDSVLIPVDGRTRSTLGRLLGCGFYTQNRTRQPMFLFLQRRITTDLPDIALSGWLGFSKKEHSYQLFDSAGNQALMVDAGHCLAKASGDIDLQLNTYALQVKLFGDMSQDASTGLITTQALTLFDFYLQADVVRLLAASLNSESLLEGVEIKPGGYVDKYLSEKMESRDYRGIQEDLELTGGFSRVPDALSQSLVFPDLELEWDPESQTFHSAGNSALLSIGGHQVGKKMKTYVSLRKNRRGDVVDIYLEASRNCWVYFSYSNNYMEVLSSDDGINDVVVELKGSQRRKERYEFFLASLSKKNTFVRKFEERYLEREQY